MRRGGKEKINKTSIITYLGMGLADVVQEEQEPCAAYLTPDDLVTINARLETLTNKAKRALQRQVERDGSGSNY